jgi:hypothetical protein
MQNFASSGLNSKSMVLTIRRRLLYSDMEEI